MTLRLQIAALLGLLTAVAVASAALISYTSTADRLQAETDAFLEDRISQVLTISAAIQEGDFDRSQELADGVDSADPSDPSDRSSYARYDAEIRFFLPDGTVAFSISDTVLPVTQAELAEAAQSSAPVSSRQRVNGRTYEARLVGFDTRSDSRAILQIGRDITGQLNTLRQLRVRLIGLAAAVVVAAAAAGYVLAGRLVKPLNSLRAATRAIADTKDFSQTVPVEGTGEISDVATDFNLMVRELDESVVQQARLVQDAGHELRTPLSTLRASLELSQRMTTRRDHLAHGCADSDKEHAALLSTAMAEVDELSRLVDELVNMAAFPFDETPVELLDLAEVVGVAVDAFGLKQPSRRVVVDVGRNQPIRGKRSHLVRAAADVLANADKFAPAETLIEVTIADNRITFSDRGPGIPADELNRVFDKFYRSSTVQTIDGSGLGLAFVAEVIRGHNGTVRAKNRDGGGAMIIFDIPAAK